MRIFLNQVILTGLLGSLLMAGEGMVPRQFRALALPPPKAASPSNDPQQLFLQNQFQEAAKAYLQALKANPSQMDLRAGLIRTYLRLDRWTDALVQAEAATRLNPQSGDAYGLLACALLRAGEPDRAQEAANRALQLDATNYWGLIAQGRLEEWKGHYNQAHAILLSATDIHPLWPEAWYYVVDAASSKNTISLQDFVDLASYLSLCPKGHPNTLTMEALPSHLPLLRKLIHNTPFAAVSPISEEQMQQAEKQPGAVQTFSTPIQLAGNYVVVPAQIENTKLNLLFDTGGGADLTIMKNVAERLHLPLISRSLIYGVNGKEPTQIYLAPSMQIGNETLKTIPLETTSSLPGDFDGILGVSAFSNYVITIDYTNKMLTFARGMAAAAPPADEGDYTVSIPFHLLDGDIVVRTFFDGLPTWSLVDTGADAEGILSLRFAHQLMQKLGPNSAKELQIQGQFGIGTSQTHQKVLVFHQPISLQMQAQEGTSLNWKVMPAIGADLLDSQISPAEDFEFGGLLGVGFMASAKRVTIDYPHGLLVFEYVKSS